MRLLITIASRSRRMGPRTAVLHELRKRPRPAARPLARRSRLFAVNTPDNRLAIYGVGAGR
jgi:hypothetical protein